MEGVNTPDSILQISCLTPKDREDLNFMLSIGVDWVALSFVQRPEDIVEIKRLIMQHNPNDAFPPHVMAKIEKPSVRERYAEASHLQSSASVLTYQCTTTVVF